MSTPLTLLPDSLLVSRSSSISVYLLPPFQYSAVLAYVLSKRATVFSSITPLDIQSLDSDGRDPCYHHLIIKDNQTDELIAAQRLLFLTSQNHLALAPYSYLEHCYPTFTIRALDYHGSFCEIGRTFITQNYQSLSYLTELIRAFIRIPLLLDINHGYGLVSHNHINASPLSTHVFLASLKQYHGASFEHLPLPLYPYSVVDKSDLQQPLLETVSILSKQDPLFSTNPVLLPYLRYCNARFLGSSIASDYNGIMQLLFYGSKELVPAHHLKRLFPPYDINFVSNIVP